MAEASAAFELLRAHRRRLQRAADAVDRVLETDRRFFARHQDRDHRIRLMSSPEREQLAASAARDDVPAPAGREWAVAVKRVSPGVRLRAFMHVPKGADLDQNEATCSRFYELVTGCSAGTSELEASLRQAFGAAS